MNREQMNAAMESLSEWLEEPQQLGREPVKIKCVGEFDLHDLHYYIFKFKKGILGRWLLGVCGGYQGDKMDHCGHVGSDMHEYAEECDEEDAIEIIEKILARQEKKTEKEQKKETTEKSVQEKPAKPEWTKEKKETGTFVSIVLLEENKWDQEEFLNTLAEEWQVQEESSLKEEKDSTDTIVLNNQGCIISVGKMPAPVPNGEAEYYAQNNYMWKEAQEVAGRHQAHLTVAVLGNGQAAVKAGELLVKAVSACCKQQGVLGVYTNGTVYQPEVYLDFAMMMKEAMFPIYNLVWFGLYEGESGVCGYTRGMGSFGYDEMEVLESMAEPHNLRTFMADIALYVIQDHVILKQGETIGFTQDEKLPITKSQGVAVEGESIKIGYQIAEEAKTAVPEQNPIRKEEPGIVFAVTLLMKNTCSMPDKDHMTTIMEKHLGELRCITYNPNTAGFAVNKYQAEYKGRTVTPQLILAGCTEMKTDMVDEFTKSQMWDCKEDRDRILTECRYQVMATEMLADHMAYRDLADLRMDYLEALVEMFPECEAVYFQTSGKLFTAAAVRSHKIPRENRFLYFAVNVRSFNIEGTKDTLVDTFGMSALNLPDLQYHFQGLETNLVVNHAYNMLTYMYDKDNPIEDGETIDGMKDGTIDKEVQWKCHYTESLIQPSRKVIDINMNEYASKGRE